jgi:vancomycin resistance protein VanJ
MTQHSGRTSRLGGMRNPFGTRSRADLLAVVPLALVLFAALAAALSPRSGPLALGLVFEPQLFIAVGVVLVPVALLARARVLSAALLVVVVAGGALFGSDWISLPGSGAARHDLTVMTWNVQYGTRTPAENVAQLQGVTADIIALQEVEPDAAAAIDADPTLKARFPYRALTPRVGAWGLAILSRYPIENVDRAFPPAVLELTVDTPHGPVHVINGHPEHADIVTLSGFRLPVGYDGTTRDAAIAQIRTRVDVALSAGSRLLVLGDYNTSASEAEFATLTRGLRDTQAQVGEGPGWTWRPSRLTFLPFAYLRIDVQLTAGAIYPASTSVDCSLPGDHCRLFGDYEID